MRKNRDLLAAVAALTACGIVVWFSASIQGREQTYDLRPEVTIPEYKTDAARAIDAYERILQRFMDLNEKSFSALSTDIKELAGKLDSIDAELTDLSVRMSGIEKALGIKQVKEPNYQQSPAEQGQKEDTVTLPKPTKK